MQPWKDVLWSGRGIVLFIYFINNIFNFTADFLDEMSALWARNESYIIPHYHNSVEAVAPVHPFCSDCIIHFLSPLLFFVICMLGTKLNSLACGMDMGMGMGMGMRARAREECGSWSHNGNTRRGMWHMSGSLVSAFEFAFY